MTTTKTTETIKIENVEPGTGAIEYAKKLTVGLTREEAAPIIEALMRGELNNPADNRVKRCDYCSYWWHDESLRNNKRTCSDRCRTKIKSLHTSERRAKEALLNPEPKEKKHTLMDDYIWWIEYPYWLNEYSMIKIGWKHEKPSGIALMNYVEAKNGLYGKGNSKKQTKEYSF
ncbi:hypothetical protein V7148_11420 [Gottfriedia acidiceleris]|uniref:hypothetical protein n=1 Tax=Gottfriedia acidiceleris TaxID=371036 RepID=UPI003000838A